MEPEKKKRRHIEREFGVPVAGEILATWPQAMQLRSLLTLQGIAGDKSSTIVFPLPIDLASALGIGRGKDGRPG